ncbi:hypothetical protein QWZ06_08060 [Chryseobacterium tructae]|uniref:DUF4870 domain-containing protein n=1 Tax=Chryseobacterium tructae TaxID=1037380 RepID=A0ABV7XU26_9FLAO|nr:hypothetical protein [Chryseobacterium tructae]MDN3692219.1 hypothetical protein [Chryseobacterium tructae]
MKKFVKYDYYAQLSFSVIAVIATIWGFRAWGFMAFYFIIGIPQLISFLVRLFMKTKKSILYIIYGITILPVWLSMLFIIVFQGNNNVTNFFGFILILALIYSPIMALLYIHETYSLYTKIKMAANQNAQKPDSGLLD